MIDPKTRREYVRTVASMLAITLACASGVALAHVLTRETVAANEQRFLKRAVLSAAGLEAPKESAAIEALYRERVRERESTPAGRRLFDLLGPPSDPRPAGLVLLETGAGLWGEIEAVVGVDPRGVITGVEFTRQSETPGLGARIVEPWFTSQFRGRRGPVTPVAEGERAGDMQFEAVTGATITTEAVRAIVNRAVEDARAALARPAGGG